MWNGIRFQTKKAQRLVPPLSLPDQVDTGLVIKLIIPTLGRVDADQLVVFVLHRLTQRRRSDHTEFKRNLVQGLREVIADALAGFRI